MNPDEHLSAFMSGLEFALLAFEGRVHDAGLDEASAERLREFIRDYRRVLEAYQARAAADPTTPPLVALVQMGGRLN